MRLLECISNDIRIHLRNGLVLAGILLTFFVCWFDFFLLMPGENVIGDALTLSSWVTEIFIIFGTIFGVVTVASEDSSLHELFSSIGYTDYLKQISKAFLIVMMTLLMTCICFLNVILALKRLQAPGVYYIETMKYILLYWSLPFLVAAFGGAGLAHHVTRRSKYAIAVLQMLLFGPLLPTIISPLIYVETDLYRFAAMFNLGPVDVSEGMNLVHGYDIQPDKIIAGCLCLCSVLVLYLGHGNNRISRVIYGGLVVFLFTSGVLVNMNYIEKEYDYYVAVNNYIAYEGNTSVSDATGLAYSISRVDLSVSEENSLRITADVTVQMLSDSREISVVLYNGFEIDRLKINDREAAYKRKIDVIRIRGDFKKNETYQIQFAYTGVPPAHMYLSKGEWTLPSYVAWYPIKGMNDSIYYGDNLFELNYYDFDQDETDYRITYAGGGRVFCNLNEQTSNSWEGRANGITLLSSKWLKQATLDSGIQIVYPVCCTNYAEYAQDYLDSYMTAKGLFDDVSKSDEGNETCQRIFFTFDSTYTGYGEKVYDFSDHTVIELTHAYLDGSYLDNPRLTVYPLIENEEFKNTLYKVDLNALSLYETAYITTWINEGVLDEDDLISSLEDLNRQYGNLEGFEEFHAVICVIEDFYDDASTDKQKKFLADLRDLILSGNELTATNVGELMEDDYD